MTSFAENTKYEVCFVQTGTSASDVTEKLQLAFEAMESNQIDPVWISTQECLQITKKEPKLFVIDPFEGEVYEHLKSVNCRIVGPLCILYCLKCEDVLPKRPYPVYSVSMRKITVSCSNIDTKSREDINKKVELMGGFFSKDLTKSVTHLVVGEVGSKKYQVAASCGLLIMVPDWVNAVWENGQHALLHATDSSFDKYKCPVFKGLIITVSQLSAEERAAIKSLVERNGGIYMGALKARETTHLVLSEPSGDKYRYARNWKVFCVNVSWIYDSTEAGYCKDETLYMIDENSKPFQPKRSTPKKDFSTDDLPFPLVDCSAITNISVITHLNETIRSDTSGPVHRKTSFSALEAFDLSLLPKYGQFLDGCKIFLTGFSPAHIDKLRKVVNAGGGIRFSKYSDSISHVVCGELGEDFLQNLKSSTVKPYVVNCNWLLECCKKEKLVEEKPFLCMDISHLSPEKVEPESKEIGPNKSINSLSKNESITGDNITDIFKQYINHETIELQNLGTVNDKKIDKSIESHDGTKSVDKEKERDTLRAGEEDDGVLDVNEEDEVTSSKELFTGLKFTVAGFGDKDSEILATMIETHSGMVLHDENIHSCDIAIVPIIWSDNNIFVPHILTNCWLQKCIEDCRLYDFDENELFRPLTVPLDKKPFQSFVISVSQYSGTERDCLMYLAEALGAVCQEYFVRRANKSKGVLSNTHLIVATPEGSKYEAAKKWNIPAVTKQWVLDAAKHGTVPPISKYMVEAAALPIEHDTKSALSSKNATIEKMNGASTHEKFNCIGTPISERNHISEPTDEIEQNNQKAVSIPVINSDKPLNKTSELDQSCKINAVNAVSVPVINPEKSVNKLSELDQSCNIKPLSPAINPDNSLSSTLDQSYNIKFHVSGLLRDLDSSMSDSPACSKRKSLPIEELFRRNLASAVRGLNATLQSEADGEPQETEKSNIDEIHEKEVDTTDGVLKGVVLCVSRKLTNLQVELNEIVSSLGGDYLWSYDNTCTHFVFTGKSNDLAKEFREARSQGKKIVSPEWLYDCKKQNLWLNEELYPHSLKTNMSLAGEISIVKISGSQNNSVQEQKEKQPKHEELLKENDTIDFNKQLNELLVAAKSAKKRQSKRLVNSLCTSPVNEVNPIQKYPRHFSDAYVKSTSLIENNAASDEPDTCSQHSQSYPITWDDPTGRMEREKIAARAATNNRNLISVKQNLQESLNSVITMQNIEKELDLKNVNFDDIDNEISVEAEIVPVQIVRKFMFTNIPEPEKTNYIEIIQNLGGTVSDEKTFDLTATHLILRNPIKNEKLLSSIASGKWILHPDYLKESEVQKRFLPEIDFEWGGPGTCKYMQNIAPNSEKLAKCPIRWRKKLNGNKDMFGAFHNWKVVVFAEDKAKLSTYTKILEAGGAEIVPTSDADSALDTISHVFVDVKKKNGCKVDLTSFVSHNIKCLKPEYLAFYLTEDPLPDVDSFILAEAKELMDASASSSKRHAMSSATRLSKRSRVK